MLQTQHYGGAAVVDDDGDVDGDDVNARPALDWAMTFVRARAPRAHRTPLELRVLAPPGHLNPIVRKSLTHIRTVGQLISYKLNFNSYINKHPKPQSRYYITANLEFHI